jgi:hypothetical protein
MPRQNDIVEVRPIRSTSVPCTALAASRRRTALKIEAGHLLDQPVHVARRLVYCHAPMAVSEDGSSMRDDDDKQERQVAIASNESRQHRLRLALRENLKRRKSQARGRGSVASSEPAESRLDDASDGEPDR